MKVSLRGKLVLLLTIVALLPLLAAVAMIVFGGRSLRGEYIGQSIQSVAMSEASALRTTLLKDIEKLQLVFSADVIRAGLAEPCRARSPVAWEELDAVWKTLSPEDPRIVEVQNNAMARELQRIREGDPRVAEIILTDCFGQLAAATGRTEDYYQADEDWWQGVEHRGDPQIYIPNINYDASSHVWSLDLCIPVLQNGELIGVGKAVVDITRWLRTTTFTVAGSEASIVFLRKDGVVIYRRDMEPLSGTLAHWESPLADSGLPGWRISDDGHIQAYARVRLPKQIDELRAEIPEWTLMVTLARAEAMGGLAELSAIVLVVGLLIIAVVFLVGLYLVNHFVVVRVYRLHRATRRVAEGDLSHRIQPRRSKWRPIAIDEIDELAEDFNFMVDQIKRGYEDLAAADQLKLKFIRVAGHELRTPVSYILGMTRLLKDSKDPARLLHAIQSMGAKAKRLDEIIQAMFKLMPEQRYSEDLFYEDVAVAELLEDVYLDCHPFIEQRNQQLIIEGGEGVPTLVADEAKLHDVLENLVMNAIKFTPDGGAIKVRAAAQLGGFCTITVQDQGPGIPEADMPHIFEPFYSGGDVMKHSSGRVGYDKRGMGLGLAIVRHFVELHGGSVSASSGPTGTIFTVTIPLKPPRR